MDHASSLPLEQALDPAEDVGADDAPSTSTFLVGIAVIQATVMFCGFLMVMVVLMLD
jgi:hypothetical protein